MNYVVGYIAGRLAYVDDMLRQYGWRRISNSKFQKGGRCIIWIRSKEQLLGVEGKGKWFRSVRGSDVTEQFALTRRFKIADTVEDFEKEIV